MPITLNFCRALPANAAPVSPMPDPLASSPLAQAYDLALRLYQSGALAETEQACEIILGADPGLAAVHLLQGTCRWERGAAGQALVAYDQAIALDPGLAEAHFNRGMALRALGRFEEALAAYDRTLACRPDWADVHFNQGNLLSELGRPDAAEMAYRRALALDPGFPGGHGNLGNLLRAQGRMDEAELAYRAAVAAAPGAADGHFNLGDCLADQGRHDEALAVLAEALRLDPTHGSSLNRRGLVFLALGRPDEALADFDAVLAAHPRTARYHGNRAVALQALGRREEAEAGYGLALELDPGADEVWFNRGQLRHETLRLDEALADYRQALALNPARAGHAWNVALARLLRGDLPAAWDDYEVRWRLPGQERQEALPVWDGKAPLAGKTLLLWAEQGLGDTLQFIRYAAMASERGARVVAEVQPGLGALLAEADGVAVVQERGAARPAFDLHCPLMSLPRAFATRVDTIPARLPYLRCPPGRLSSWRDRLGPAGGLRVGLVWSGSPTHGKDAQRSIPLAAFAALWSIPRVEWVSLQAQVRDSDRAALSASPLLDFSAEIGDFADTAAIVEQSDLVISVDTAAAHLAGALGRPLWLLLPHLPDWRWLLEREDSPWYPGARLFRQGRDGDWAPVIERVGVELNRLVAARS